jgi:Holliday junction resolvase
VSAKSRNKGSGFERDVARILCELTGVRFQRNLEQVRAADHGDLVPDDPAFPFLIECKRYASGVSCLTAWKDQASRAAAASRKIPAVVFRFDRRPVRVAVPLWCAAGSRGQPSGEWAEISVEGLAYLASEFMAERADARL